VQGNFSSAKTSTSPRPAIVIDVSQKAWALAKMTPPCSPKMTPHRMRVGGATVDVARLASTMDNWPRSQLDAIGPEGQLTTRPQPRRRRCGITSLERAMPKSEPCRRASHAEERAMPKSEPCRRASHAEERAMPKSEPCRADGVPAILSEWQANLESDRVVPAHTAEECTNRGARAVERGSPTRRAQVPPLHRVGAALSQCSSVRRPSQTAPSRTLIGWSPERGAGWRGDEAAPRREGARWPRHPLARLPADGCAL